ncbi:NlpC/P60 family protein, partial [Amycolatopsis sp. NPDC000673]
GGGNGSGPTRGIRDGGVADQYGDYRKIGFDCSGLMIYAFAGVQGLPHFSGYQYTSGRRVPLSQMRRGDMLFWGGSGGIHHVALYLGNGQMVEAPQSGSYVRVVSVRYGGIMPYATRLIG